MKHEQVIYGNAPSKANQYKIITLGGHGSLAKTQALKEYEQKVINIIPKLNGFIGTHVDTSKMKLILKYHKDKH